jgi:hypothetical protein
MAYTTVAAVRALGVTEEMADDNAVEIAISDASNRIDVATGSWFEEREMTLRLDGSGGASLSLPIPIVEITTAFINGAKEWDEEADLDDFVVRNNLGRGLPDDRRNPRITHKSRFFVFHRGEQNQVLIGTFGYVEHDGSTPLLIQQATARLAAIIILNPTTAASLQTGSQTQQGWIQGPLSKETTDGHSIEYGAEGGGLTKTTGLALGLVSTDPFIQTVLRRYTRPMTIASA